MRLDASAWLDHLEDARTLALAGDIEGVHQVRVAARRLRVWLDFKGHEALEAELRWLCGELALSRDLDVYGEVFTTDALAELRPKAMEETVEALESERFFMLRDRLRKVRAPRRSKAKRSLRKLERRLETRRESLAPRDGPALHRLRRTLRRVRYAREWLGRDALDLAHEQDRLGALCDLLSLHALARQQQAEIPAQLTEAIAHAYDLLEAK